jgi:hypothetical protein
MKIAVIEDDNNIVVKIQQKIDNDNFELCYYQDTDMFLNNIQSFDLVLIDNKFITKDLVHKISGYKLEIGLINNGNLDFDDEHIAIVLDNEGLDQISEKLKYFETKIRIKNLVDIEEKTLDSMQKLSIRSDFLKTKQKENQEFLKKIIKSSYYFEIQDNIAILEIRDLIAEFERNEILANLKHVNYRVAAYFSSNRVTSRHLGILANLWKDVKSKKGKVVYWNKQNDSHIISVLKLCKLDNIIPIIDSFDDVKKKLKEI